MFVQYVLVSTPAISRIYVEPKISKISRKSKCTGKDIDWSFHQRKWMIHHLCLEDSGSYKNGCGSKATGFTPKELTIETPAGAILGHDSWRVSPFFVDLVPFVSVSCPSRPQPTWGTLPWPTNIMLKNILGERRPMTARSFFSLTSKVKYFFKFLMIITSVGVEQHGTTQDPTTKVYWWFQAHWKHNCIICGGSSSLSFTEHIWHHSVHG